MNSISANQVEAFTRKKIAVIQAQSGNNSAILAQLRRGIGKSPGEIPQLWGYFLESMPEEFFGETEPSRAEWAVYISLTLFALHQQGKNIATECMQLDERSFGTAMSRLIHGPDDGERVTRRFNTIATSAGIEELAHHMRGAVSLLRSDGIGLDYPKLAGDIYRYQFPEFVSSVRLRWGQDYYRKRLEETESAADDVKS